MPFSFYPRHDHNCPNVSHCPHLGGAAIYLRNVIGISYRKIPQAIEELFGITFTPAALIGFETMLAEKAKPIVDDIAKKPGSSDEAHSFPSAASTPRASRRFAAARFSVHARPKTITERKECRAPQPSRPPTADTHPTGYKLLATD